MTEETSKLASEASTNTGTPAEASAAKEQAPPAAAASSHPPRKDGSSSTSKAVTAEPTEFRGKTEASEPSPAPLPPNRAPLKPSESKPTTTTIPSIKPAASQQTVVSPALNASAPKLKGPPGEKTSSVPPVRASGFPAQNTAAGSTNTTVGQQYPPPPPAPSALNATNTSVPVRNGGLPSATVQPAFGGIAKQSNVMSPQHKQMPVTKKRKLGNKPLPVTQLLADHPAIQKTTHNLLGLLETYGPLTAGQLEYNLPPITGERVNSQTIHDIVQVLVCTGVVQRVCDPPVGQPNNRPTNAPRYCVNGGVPRADVILPHKILEQISAAHDEIKRSDERRGRLKKALSSKGSTKDMLKEMAIEFPEIIQDPVYLSALKSFHIDFAVIERERRVRQQQAYRAAAAERATAASGANSSTPAAKTAPATCKNNNANDGKPR